MRLFKVIPIGAFCSLMVVACETAPSAPVEYKPPVSSHHKLAGTSWILETDLARDPIIEFKSNGHLGGFAGCNLIGGVFEESSEIKDGRHMLMMSEVFSTEMACPSAMETEQAFIRAISASKSFKKSSANTLILYDGDGNEVLRLNRNTD